MKRPSGWRLVRYRMGGRIPQRYEAWVRADISSKWFPLQDLLRWLAGLPIYVYVASGIGLEWPRIWASVIGLSVAGILSLLFSKEGRRERNLAWHEKNWKRELEADRPSDPTSRELRAP